MATDILMPKWGLTMKEGKLSKWLKNEGDTVQAGEPIFEVETDKITNVVEATSDGVLFQIVVPAGETVAVKTVVGVLAAAGETPDKKEQTAAPSSKTEVASQGGQEASDTTPKEGFVLASPIARRLAKEQGIDLHDVTGTGPNGRVTEKDILSYTPPPDEYAGFNAAPQAIALAKKSGIDLSEITGTGEGGKILKVDVLRAMQPAYSADDKGSAGAAAPEILPFSGMRKIIADNMMASLHNMAQLTAFVECDVTEMTAFRDRVRAKYAKNDAIPRVSYNDIIAVAVSRTLMKYPYMNSWLTDEGIVRHKQVNLGIAVALDEGLVVPHIKDAEKKSLTDLAVEIREVAGKARKGGLTMDELQGGTFTITNVSMLGVDGFTPIINPPEIGILGVGRAVQKPAVDKNGNIVSRTMMTLSLTFDHRVVDGAPAMNFLRALADCLEDPAMMLA
ncbi:dihydrolipoamide acetyltransferase family protein [Desulfogranum japonicum]|uniref:dihydrolipoamide acetyltransferase family protein n=1 Tax=Desulfogranum japonicum TaxID=231447 RepID=UPI0004110F4F|nr:dihydrolipoamide acetyltransferase family protein [Desulfogranum japonicum]